MPLEYVSLVLLINAIGRILSNPHLNFPQIDMKSHINDILTTV
jgi:hypothetical protein